MKATISASWRWHMWDLARELQSLGHLQRLHTIWRPWGSWELPRQKVLVHRGPFIMSVLTRRLAPSCWYAVDTWAGKVFDKWSARKLEPCDIATGVTSFSLQFLKRARELGAAAVTDSGTSHIVWFADAIAREHEVIGIPPPVRETERIELQLAEYEIADRIFVGSNFARKTFLEKGISPQKLVCVNYGVDDVFFTPPPEPVRGKPFRVFFAGGVRPIKGLHYLLAAMDGLPEKDFKLMVAVAGPDELASRLRGRRVDVTALGPLKRLAMREEYRNCSVFVQASVAEGFGLTILEAMACGAPVIATTNSGAPDIIEDGVEGFVVPPRDPEAIREKLIWLFEHEEARIEMGRRARAKAEKTNWAVYGRKVAEEYEKILAERQRQG